MSPRFSLLASVISDMIDEMSPEFLPSRRWESSGFRDYKNLITDNQVILYSDIKDSLEPNISLFEYSFRRASVNWYKKMLF